LALSLTLLILGGPVSTYPSSVFVQLFIVLALADHYRSWPCYRGAL
jgi:hypothetical protein